MSVREKTPDKILISSDFLKSAITESMTQKETEKEHENSKNLSLAFLGGLISCLLSLIPSWNEWSTSLKVIISIITGAFALLFLWFLIKVIQSRKKLKGLSEQELEDRIINEAKQKIRYTALLIICYQKSKSGEVKFMTEKRGNYLIHCNMDPYKGVYEQKENIINHLAISYSIQKNQIVDVTPLSEEPFFSIKPIHGETTQNGFIFYQIYLKKKAKQNLLSHRDASWKSIHEMEEIPELMGRNQDIVMALNENRAKITESFGDSQGPMHIIWNITKACPYNCAICATRDETRSELSTDNKLRVLRHIFSAKERISTLDFAGGDPMYSDGVRTVIMQAVDILGEDFVSITTTGKGIQAINHTSDEDMAKLLSRCEITIDASHENLAADNSKSSAFSRESPEYCNHNYTQIQSVSENLQHLIINIPILDDNLDESEISNLKMKLQRLKQDYADIQMEAQIIRLMPVGAFNDSYRRDNYEKYNPINTAIKITTCVEEIGIPCRYHCSLRILPKIEKCDRRCNMLSSKIGIDCSGNVFACTWGAYLPLPKGHDIAENPFYLGNLIESSLQDILDGRGRKTEAYKRISRNISNETPKPYCEAVSWFFKNDLNENNDPLSKNSDNDTKN